MKLVTAPVLLTSEPLTNIIWLVMIPFVTSGSIHEIWMKVAPIVSTVKFLTSLGP